MKRILIVTGQSGSGKSSALQVLEDLGYYCIDNLPLALLPEIVAKLDHENNLEQLALGVDVRSTRADMQEFDHVFEQLQKHGTVDVIYLTTQDQDLIARFSASRRPHLPSPAPRRPRRSPSPARPCADGGCIRRRGAPRPAAVGVRYIQHERDGGDAADAAPSGRGAWVHTRLCLRAEDFARSDGPQARRRHCRA